MPRVDFKFDVGDEVFIPSLGIKGIVDTLAYDAGGLTYIINTASGSDWWREELLTEDV